MTSHALTSNQIVADTLDKPPHRKVPPVPHGSRWWTPFRTRAIPSNKDSSLDSKMTSIWRQNYGKVKNSCCLGWVGWRPSEKWLVEKSSMTWIHLIYTWNLTRDSAPKIDEFSSSTSIPRGFDKPFLTGRNRWVSSDNAHCSSLLQSESLRTDQEEQLPGFQSEPHPAVCTLFSAMPATAV